MDLDYLKDKILDELQGAKEYAKMAIELKPMTDAWSKKFITMSEQEHAHASNFYSMFNDYCTKLSTSYVAMPDYILNMRKEVIDAYTECSAAIKHMWEMYKS